MDRGVWWATVRGVTKSRTWLSMHKESESDIFGVSEPHSVMSDSATPCILACQAPLSMGFSRQEYSSGYAIPSYKGSSWSRDWTQLSLIAGKFFTIWATILLEVSVKRECLLVLVYNQIYNFNFYQSSGQSRDLHLSYFNKARNVLFLLHPPKTTVLWDDFAHWKTSGSVEAVLVVRTW